MIKLPKPTAFVFTSGAARAASQVGMLAAVLDAGITPDLVVGSSTGAINAAVYASHPITAVSRLESVWQAIAADSSLSSTWRSAVRGVTGNQSARTTAMLSKHLARHLGQATFDDLSVPLALTATDLETGLPVIIGEGGVRDGVLASCAFPVMFPPAVRGDRYLTDGSVVAGMPVLQARDLGAKSIVLFDTGSSAVSEATVAEINWYSVAALAFSHLVRGQSAHDLAEVAAEIPVAIISSDEGSPIDLRATPPLIAAGRAIAEATLDGWPRTIKARGIYGQPIGTAADERIAALLRKPRRPRRPRTS